MGPLAAYRADFLIFYGERRANKAHYLVVKCVSSSEAFKAERP